VTDADVLYFGLVCLALMFFVTLFDRD